ncbi:MAG TPA: hypothetical protein VFX59_03315, partial [Polyangiales bacterium]|nr:hypothetical protein [Polyangiales bacterium]
MSAVITTWLNLIEVDGKVVEAASWDPILDRIVAYGQAPFRGDKVHPGWSPVRMDPPRRQDANVRAVTALAIDYDGGHSFDEGVEMWRPFYGLMHSTRRHTPAQHRFRVILPLAREVTPDEYALLWVFVVSTSGHHVDVKTKNPSRFWFMPGPADGGEFLAQRLYGSLLDPDPMIESASHLATAQAPSNVTPLHRGDTRELRYASGAFADECNRVGMAAPGERNNLLFHAAATAGNFIAVGALGEAEAWSHLEQAALVCGLPRFEARRTIQSGIVRGKQSPRRVPESSRAASHPPAAAQGATAEPAQD